MRPRFNLLDGIICMEGNGPGSGIPAFRGFLAGSRDALALDESISPKLGVPDLLLLECAKKRNLLPEITDQGEIPPIQPLALPIPSKRNKLGVWIPPGVKGLLSQALYAYPKLSRNKCIGCGVCVRMCPPRSLKLIQGKPVFDLKNCIRCYCCQEHCPQGAIVPYKTWARRLTERILS